LEKGDPSQTGGSATPGSGGCSSRLANRLFARLRSMHRTVREARDQEAIAKRVLKREPKLSLCYSDEKVEKSYSKALSELIVHVHEYFL
jgi:hypothetical protein